MTSKNKKKLFVLTTDDRVYGRTENPTFDLANPLLNISEVSLESVTIPYVFWNTYGANQTIPLYEPAGLPTYQDVSLANQHFDNTNIADGVAASLTSASTAGNVYTCTFDDNTSLLTINSTGLFSLQWTTQYQDQQLGYPNTMWKILGFNNDPTTTIYGLPDPDTPIALSCQSSGACELAPRNLYLNVSPLGTPYITSNVQTSVSYSIPINANWYEKITFNRNKNDDQKIQINIKGFNIKNLTLSLKYGNGQPVDLHGAEWICTFGYIPL